MSPRKSSLADRDAGTGATSSSRLQKALALPNGARFYRCALQVNPFAYLVRHKKQTAFKTEEEYNAAIELEAQEI